MAHTLRWVEGADHAFMRYAWAQEAIAQTVGWLNAQ
jgi:hypothetical protein